MSLDERHIEICKKLLKPPMAHSKRDNGPLDFPNPEKQAKEILTQYVTNEISKSEISLAHTYSTGNKDLMDVKLTNILTLYEDNPNIRAFTVLSFYLLRLKALSSEYDTIPIELLPLQKLGYYNNIRMLEASPSFRADSEFLKRFPKGFARLKNSLQEYPFFITVSNATSSTDCACYEYDENIMGAYNSDQRYDEIQHLRTNISEEDCGNDNGYLVGDNGLPLRWQCNTIYNGVQNNSNEKLVIDAIDQLGVYEFVYGKYTFAFYDDIAGKVPGDFPDRVKVNVWLPWSKIYRSTPVVNAHDTTNFEFEHYKTRWSENEWPDSIIMSPKRFLVEAGYINEATTALSKLENRVNVHSLATYLQANIWDIWEKDSDLKIILSPEVVALGMKILGGHLFIPRSELANDFSDLGYSFGNDPLLPAGAAINAKSADVKITGTFTTMVIDPVDRKYIEDQYYRFRANKDMK